MINWYTRSSTQGLYGQRIWTLLKAVRYFRCSELLAFVFFPI